MNSTYAARTLLVLSLAANVALGWMLWRKHTDAPAVSIVQPSTEVAIPIPDLRPVDLAHPRESGQPPVGIQHMNLLMPGVSAELVPQKASAVLPPAPRKAYGPPPPPNPHASPPWPERVPYRESQMPRGLYSTPLKLDKE